MTTSTLNSTDALKDLNQIKQVLNETSYRVNKLYLFFYGVAIIYLIPFLFSFISLIPFSTDVRLQILMIQGYIQLSSPILFFILFITLKVKILPKSNRFAHKLLHIWMYGFMIIFFGFLFIQYRTYYFAQSYMLAASNLQTNDFNLINDIIVGFNFITPFLTAIVILFIYLMMNLLTNKKGFLIGFFVNLIAYFIVIWLLPSIPLVINELLEMSLLNAIFYCLINNGANVLLITNLLVMGTYFKKLYRLEQIEYEH